MSIDREVCKVVKQRWSELGHEKSVPEHLEFFKVQGKLSKNAAIIALIIDGHTQESVAVAKIPRNPECTMGIDAELSAMESMRKCIDSWQGAANIPHQGFMATILGSKVLIQSAKQGYSLVRDMTDQQNIQHAYSHVLPWMLDFHKSSVQEVMLEGDTLQQLVTAPVEQFVSKIGALEGVQLSDFTKKYFDELANEVKGSKVKLCHKHGDFNAHNIIVTDSTKSDGIYIIDWEDYLPNQLPIHDLNHFFISNSKLVDMNLTSGQAFEKYMLSDGWYKKSYIEAINKYEAEDFISTDIFLKLSPLYMAEICISMMSEHRQQESTINVWLSRIDEFINNFSS